MIMQIYFFSFLMSIFSFGLAKINPESDREKVTVIGKARLTKSFAGVETDSGTIYYLDGIHRWEDKYLGKRVKVKGRLILRKFNLAKTSDDTEVTAIPQQRYGTYHIIKKPKWKLVKQ